MDDSLDVGRSNPEPLTGVKSQTEWRVLTTVRKVLREELASKEVQLGVVIIIIGLFDTATNWAPFMYVEPNIIGIEAELKGASKSVRVGRGGQCLYLGEWLSMPRYKLVVQEVYDVWYEVEGETEDDAYEMYYEGEGEMIDQQYSHMIDDSPEIVENLDATDAEVDEAIKNAQKKMYWDTDFKMFKEMGVGDEEDIL